ncbi:MAG: diguanylate cyclase response regulator [Spirochaetaceae bacterium 4572_59]|nr:MAG: diguanylate cyclase response regulator [Spirochaetaceae bacterium 4572_59]
MNSLINLLIVDDRHENLLTLESLLDHPDFNIIKADSGSQALEKMLENDIALILLDVFMPDMNGYETAELMRSNKRTKHIPIIFVTAELAERDHIFKGYDAGAVDYLMKPIAPQVLQSKVGIFLEIHRQKLELEKKTRELNAKVRELEELQQQLKEKNKQLKTISTIDALTGIYNRRYFNEMIEMEWSRSKRNGSLLSLILMDIDHFKTYNDTYGHSAGDNALKAVAKAISIPLKRKIDTIARYGGEEFIAILPEIGQEGVLELGKKMMESVRNMKLEHKGSPVKDYLTISMGIHSVVPDDNINSIDVINAADKALYLAKDSGRDCIIVYNKKDGL